MALPVFGLQKAPRDLSMWTDYPVKLTEPVRIDPFIEINLDNGPVTIGDLTFSTSNLQPVRLSTGYYFRRPMPKETINLTPSRETIEKLRDILKSNDGTFEIVWGPDILPNWVRIDYRGSKHSNLIPLSRENHIRSDFFDSQNKEYGGLMKSFYHIQYKDTSTLWARIYGTPKELISGKGFSHET